MMEVKIKKMAENAVMPVKANSTDAAYDFTAVSEHIDVVNRTLTYNLGWAVEIPPGHVGLLFPRGSIANKDIALANSVGVVDSGFRGELLAKFKNTVPSRAKKYDIGDRIVQLIVLPIPEVKLVVAETLSESDRGTGGWGSSGS